MRYIKEFCLAFVVISLSVVFGHNGTMRIARWLDRMADRHNSLSKLRESFTAID